MRSTPIALIVCLLAAPALAAPAAPTYPITLDTAPPGAAVYIDGKDRGLAASTPAELRLTRGRHVVRLELAGHASQEIPIAVSQAQRFTWKLEPLPAKLEVRAAAAGPEAAGAAVYLDGEPRGAVPVSLEIPAGRHELAVRQPGYLDHAESLELRPGEERPIAVQLQPAPPAPRPPVVLIARDQRSRYEVATPAGSCSTPCTLNPPPGILDLQASHNGRAWSGRVEIPAQGHASIVLQHDTSHYRIGGGILIGLSLGAIAATIGLVPLTVDVARNPDRYYSPEPSLIGLGAGLANFAAMAIAFGISGTVTMASYRPASVAVVPQ